MDGYAPAFNIRKAFRRYAGADSPVTNLLMIVVAVVFLAEVSIAALLSLSSIRIFSTGIFGVYPSIAWPFSPVLHRGYSHFAATMIGLTVVGIPIENHWSRKRYAVFILGSGYITIGIGTGVLWLFSDNQLAFYGTSGVIYALGGFSLTHLPRYHDDFNRIEKLALVVGFAALISVVLDPFTEPYFEPHWINGGHASGFVIGIIVGWFSWNGNCS